MNQDFTAYFRTSTKANQFIQALGSLVSSCEGPTMVAPVDGRGWVVKISFGTYSSSQKHISPEVLSSVVSTMKRFDGSGLTF